MCQSYSTAKQEAYFEKPTLAFLWIWFAFISEEGKEFATNKFKSQEKEAKDYVNKMIFGVKGFGREAYDSLVENKNTCSLSKKLTKYIEAKKWKL